MKRVTFFLISALFLVISSCDKQAETDFQDDLLLKKGRQVLTFSAHLSGSNEVHTVVSEATGKATFQLSKDGNVLSYKLIVEDIENVTMAHIHLGAPGINGGVVLWLYPSSPPAQLIPGYSSGMLKQGEATSSNLVGALAGQDLSVLIDHMIAGNAYVNVHTSQYGAGEIRGQISLNGNIKE